MTTETPKVQFSLGSEVSPGHFFKSTFARNFVTNCHEYKSLDYELLVEADGTDRNNDDAWNNNFSSLKNFTDKLANEDEKTLTVVLSKPQEAVQQIPDVKELEKLRKQCQSLAEENQKLRNASLQNVFLQTRVDTLQWQVKQVESNRQMYRSLMEQVARFLDRTHKSLDILRDKNNPKITGGRVPRSRSVNTVHVDSSLSRGPSTSSSSSASSGLIRAKSATRTSSGTTGFREFTRSILRRNDPARCTPAFAESPQNLNKTHDSVVYQEPKQSKLNPDEIPPEKLSQEAFRLLRTVQSLLAAREPDLAKVIPMDNNESTHSSINYHKNDRGMSPTLQSGNFANSTMFQQSSPRAESSNSDCGNESNGAESDNKSCCIKPTGISEINRNLQVFLPGVRRSVDATSLLSGSSKTEEEDAIASAIPTNGAMSDERTSGTSSPSASNKAIKKLEKKGSGVSRKSKSPVSSIGDESGFCSMSSFQEVGLPSALPLSFIKGYHTEIGLPTVPLDKARHRRWSSTPAEIQALLKHHRASFNGSQVSTKSVSIWV